VSQKKRNAPPTQQPTWDEIKVSVPADGKVVLADCVPITHAPEQDPRAETLFLLEAARDRLRVTAGFGFTEADVTKRLLIAVLESMTPEQRADVRRRLGA
jgi:hypothetical protein